MIVKAAVLVLADRREIVLPISAVDQAEWLRKVRKAAELKQAIAWRVANARPARAERIEV